MEEVSAEQAVGWVDSVHDVGGGSGRVVNVVPVSGCVVLFNAQCGWVLILYSVSPDIIRHPHVLE